MCSVGILKYLTMHHTSRLEPHVDQVRAHTSFMRSATLTYLLKSGRECVLREGSWDGLAYVQGWLGGPWPATEEPTVLTYPSMIFFRCVGCGFTMATGSPIVFSTCRRGTGVPEKKT